jgi:hypothetical protein
MTASPPFDRLGGVGLAVRLALDVAREERALRSAVKLMPKPVPWDWAAPRLIPIIAGPAIDPPGERCVRVRSDLGPMVEIGLDLGSAFTFVDTRVAERWECSPDQLMQRAVRNLGERAARIHPDRIQTGVMSGREIRVLRDRPRWSSSLLLAPDALFRLFGGQDQILAAPCTDCLLSLPIDTPPVVVADIVVDFERAHRRPLWLDPFVLFEGELLSAHHRDEDELADAQG